MQIDQIRITDVIKKDNAREMEGLFSGPKESPAVQEKAGELRAIRMNNPFYHKEQLKEQTVGAGLEEQLSSGLSVGERHNQMVVYSQTTSEQDVRKMAEEGYDPMEMDSHTIVTVTDKIKMALAKGGADISAMGGVSDEVVEVLSGTQLQANQIKTAMSQMDLPVDDELLSDAMTAVRKLEEIPPQVSEEGIKYLMSNELEPTISNLYQASYATGSGEPGSSSSAVLWEEKEIPEEMQGQIHEIIEEAGREVTEETIEDCRWMMENELPVTSDNLTYLTQLKDARIEPGPEDAAEMIANAVAMGKRPEDGYVLPEFDLMAKAKQVMQHVWEESSRADLTDIQARRTLEEARLLMSVQANYQLLKQGIAIDVMSIEEVVEQLKQQEEACLKELLAADSMEQTAENVERYIAFTQQMEELADMPAVALGKVPEISQAKVEDLIDVAKPMKVAYEEANTRYETMQTQVRPDLGDSMKKAFANVDDILEDLQLDLSDENRRAVRILAYNRMELSEENITKIKAGDVQVQKLFRTMTPSVVTDMIRSGENPLDKTIGELNDMAEGFSGQSDSEESAKDFAKFLWKMEQNNELTPEQRESYIGIYRLIHQVEKGDGAAIGALIAQGTEVTLRNLMMAVRSRKHTGRDYVVDDDFGGLSDVQRSSLSITQQIEAAYQKDCLSEAGREMTPVKMSQFESEEQYLNMSPEQFRDRLVEMKADPEVAAKEEVQAEAYAKQIRNELSRALSSEEQVYEILERYELPTTPAFLEGISQMLDDRNQVYRGLNQYAKEKDEDITISDLMEDLLEDFGEAIKTPEDMAEAQRRLEETAENVMKNMLVEQEVTSIDLRGMKLIMTQIKAMGQMSEHSETYHLPILVEDQIGNLSLKIVRGQDEKGLVDVALNMESTGNVKASFRYEAGEITGDLSFEKQSMRELFADRGNLLADVMTEATGLPVSFRFAWDHKISTADFYREDGGPAQEGWEGSQEQDPVSTKVLYGVAKSFIDTLTEILS